MKRKLILDTLIILSLFMGFQVLRSCKKIEREMLVTTGDAANILANSADITGIIINPGEGAIQHGHCYAKTSNVTVNNDKTELGVPSIVGDFTSQLKNLEAGTAYYVKAYISDGKITIYGNEIRFSTLAPSVPVVATATISSITKTTAISGGDITSDGGSQVTVRGVCWSTTAGPLTSSSKTTDGTGSGSYASSLTGLTPGASYFVRAYATNIAGTSYGNEISFNALAEFATLTTTAVSSVTHTTASSGGNITADGGAPVTARGICWSTSANPTIGVSPKTTDGTGSGSYTSNLTGLTAGTTYYVRAYATNTAGTAYGNEKVFPTLQPLLPSLSTAPVTSIAQTSATCGGNITSDGYAPITARGVCWSTSVNPTIETVTKTTDSTGSGVYMSSITGLTPLTTYYIRAYATNRVGTTYGNETSFRTLAELPTLTTSSIVSITQTTASSGGNITADGGAPVISRGICWSTSANPAVEGSTKTTDGQGSGGFTSTLTGLTAGTTYHVRAYATNSSGTSYGNDLSFITCFAGIPAPVIVFESKSEYTDYFGTQFIRYSLDITNYSLIPDALFADAPELPPCGLNANSARTWVNILDDKNNYVYIFCDLDSAKSLNDIWFGVRKGVNPPTGVYITLDDRKCDVIYKSNIITIP